MKLQKPKTKQAEPDPGPYLDNARFEGEVYFPSGSGLTFGIIKYNMKIRPKVLIIAYFIWLLFTMSMPALDGSLWPTYVPLALLAILYLALAKKHHQRVIGILLTTFSVFLIVSDVSNGKRRDVRMKEQMKQIELKNDIKAEPER
jgi:hypothetical protein